MQAENEQPSTGAPQRPLNQVVAALAAAIGRALPPGDVAALRRMAPDDLATPAFWKLAGTHLADELRGEGPAAEARERRWAVLINALARTAGLHAPGKGLGAALAQAGLSELRLTRLLRVQGDAVPPEVRAVSSYLAAKAMPFDATDLARLILSEGGPAAEQVRRGIARGYFGQLTRNEKSTSRRS